MQISALSLFLGLFFFSFLALAEGFQRAKAAAGDLPGRCETCLHFKEQLKPNTGAQKQPQGSVLSRVWQGLRRFLPDVTRARTEEAYASTPKGEAGQRFHVRITRPEEERFRRHVATRIMRYFPDVSYGVAVEMVERAQEEGTALVRVMSDKEEARYLVNLLRLASPPVGSHVYDAKTDEILP